jgi:hypothetical protein
MVLVRIVLMSKSGYINIATASSSQPRLPVLATRAVLLKN